MIKHVTIGIIKTVIISIIVNNVRIKATDISSEDDKLFTLNEDEDGIGMYKDQPPYDRKETFIDQNEDENEEDIKALLEEKYKFRNDESSTRFKVTRQDRGEFSGSFIELL